MTCTSLRLLAYYVCVCEPLQVISPKGGQLFSALKEHCPILFESYWPTPWGYNRHITSIFRAKFQRGVHVKYTRYDSMHWVYEGSSVAWH